MTTSPSRWSRSTRLASVVLAWNVFQHFYPYFEIVKGNWNDVLVRTLRKAAMDEDERAFLDTLRELVAQLHDGHAIVKEETLPDGRTKLMLSHKDDGSIFDLVTGG